MAIRKKTSKEPTPPKDTSEGQEQSSSSDQAPANQDLEAGQPSAQDQNPGDPNEGGNKGPFPTLVFIYLLFVAGASIIGLFVSVDPPCWMSWVVFIKGETGVQAGYAFVMFFGGGIGATIISLFALMNHFCDLQDYEPRYRIWYLIRPIVGALVGLIFFFIIQGGLMAVTNDSAELNRVWFLAGIGVFAGMFSKNAIEKLREQFQVMFATKDGLERELNAEAKNRSGGKLS